MSETGDELIAGLRLEPVPGPVLCRSERRVRGRVRVREAAEVAAVVKACRERGWGFHPISSGKNWGLGSYLPSRDDQLLLDLSALKMIGPIDQHAGTIRIEAGVTQRELFDWLGAHAPEFGFSVTGAGANTSITGNALDRGLGYGGSRADELFGHEAVLPDGSWHRPHPALFSTTGGIPLGPRFDTLWSQNEFGVVTASWLKLRWRQEAEAAVVVSGEFDAVFECLQRAYRRNVLTLPVHMGGGQRAQRVGVGLLRDVLHRDPTESELENYFPSSGETTAIGALHGSRRVVRAGIRELKRIAPRGARIRSITAASLAWADRLLPWLGQKRTAIFLRAFRPLFAFTWGEPSDAGMVSLSYTDGDDNPDHARRGCVYFNAISPLEAAASKEVESVVKQSYLDYGVTRVIMSAHELVHVISAEFDDGETVAAHRTLEEISRELMRRGYPPYRPSLACAAAFPELPTIRYDPARDGLAGGIRS